MGTWHILSVALHSYFFPCSHDEEWPHLNLSGLTSIWVASPRSGCVCPPSAPCVTSAARVAQPSRTNCCPSTQLYTHAGTLAAVLRMPHRRLRMPRATHAATRVTTQATHATSHACCGACHDACYACCDAGYACHEPCMPRAMHAAMSRRMR